MEKPSQDFSKDGFLNGQILLIDKPLGWTSFQVVNKLRWLIRKQFGIKKIKVGHAGTLDPLATGLLVICTGKFTKRIPELMSGIKMYSGVIRLGSTTPSYDLETAIDNTYPTEHISAQHLHAVKEQLTGEIMQVPPIYSAIKQDGERLYELARKGQTAEIPARPVTIFQWEVLDDSTFPDVFFRVTCSKGTYIRTLANDFGQLLQSGAHLAALRRESSGSHSVEDAFTIETFTQLLARATS